MLWIVIPLVAACAAAAALVPIDMVVTSAGRVVAMQPTVVVQPLETAIVRGRLTSARARSFVPATYWRSWT